jgi:two-component system CheB/CheR fusion protein
MPDEKYDPDPHDQPSTDGQQEQNYDAGAGPEDAPLYAPGGPVVVGIGASAGGVEACKTFFNQLPDAEGMAFVVILHLPPEEESRLAEIIGQTTPLPVTQVTGEEPIEGAHVYVIPPGKNLLVRDDVLYLEPIEDERVRRAPVDHFFRSLADHYAHRMAGVILSGTGANGSVGARLIRERGGIVLTQDPLEAAYDEMPRNAIDNGVADHIATLKEMGDLLVTFRDQVGGSDEAPEEEAAPGESDQKAVQKILAQLRSRTGHDFSHYKRATVLRRIARRMHVTRSDTYGAYLSTLRHSGREPDALLADLLINVTNFFRHPQAFDTLEREVIPQLFEGKEATDDVRVWVPACATGEEAYSIAILLDEHMSRLAVQGATLPDIQVLATDLSREAVETARAGRYPTSIEADVSPERLERYFRKQDEHYRVRKELREMVLFAPHSLLKDPPFSRLDLVSCRNLLIYLQPELQERILAQFHYSLRSGGYLFLGTSETVSTQSDLFTMVDKPARIYRARDVQTPHPHLPTNMRVPRHVVPMPSGPGEKPLRLPQARQPDHRPPALQDAESRHVRLRADAAPPSVVADREDHAVLHVYGGAEEYLQIAPGTPTQNLLRLVRPELRPTVQTTLFEANKTSGPAWSRPVEVEMGGERRHVRVQVRPDDDLVLVAFQEVAVLEVPAEHAEGKPDETAAETRERQQATAEQLQLIIEEYETSQEELRAQNEELQSVNEELRSTAEELETSKEEAQSMAEELQTVNDEYRKKAEELAHSKADLENLLHATEIATVFLDRDLYILRFTPRVREHFHILSSDVGRPLADLAPRFGDRRILEEAEAALEMVEVRERTVEGADGRWHQVQMRPYRDVDGRITGVVITFVDVTDRQKLLREAEAAREYADKTIDTVREGLLVLTPELRVERANESFYELFQTRPEAVEGRLIFDLGNGQWNIPELRRLLEEVLPENDAFDGYDVTHDFESLGRRTMVLNGRRLDHVDKILLAIEDATERKEAQRALAEREEHYRHLLDDVREHAIVMMDREGRITSWNRGAEQLFRTGEDDALGEPLALLFAEDDREAGVPEQVLKEAAEAGHASRERWHPRLGAEGRFWGVSVTSAYHGVEGEVAGYVLILRDATERKKAEDALLDLTETLEERVTERTRQVRALSVKLTMAEQEERHRIAQILHDDLQQLLFGVQMKVRFAREDLEEGRAASAEENAEEANEWLRRAIETTRQLTVDLSPPILQGEGLMHAMEWLVRQMGELHQLDVALEAERAFVIEDEELRVLLFQAVRELLFNVAKHAGTDRATVRLEAHDYGIAIHVIDEGAGFDPDEFDAEGAARQEGADSATGLGLFSVRERIRLIGGRVEVDAAPGEGTHVTIVAPLTRADLDADA